jgi:hypothetical protein
MGRDAVRPGEFLDLAKLQQDVTLKGGTHWAPIHEIGNAPGGPFYVTDNYRQTAQSLIKFRVAAKPITMHRIIHSTLSGLEELKKYGGRAHGNLKPSNILLSGSRRKLRVFLTDPSAAAYQARDAEEQDLRAVGELIHELVLHEKPPAVVQSIAPSEAWASFKNGDRWLDLCNRLLNPAGSAMPSLAEVRAEVAKLRPRRSRGRVAVYATVGVLILATALLIPWYRANSRTWEQLVAQEGWLGQIEPYLRENSESEDEKRAWRDRIRIKSDDKDLLEIVSKWEDPNGKYSRANLPLTPDQIREIAAHPPISPGAMRNTREALRAAAELRLELENWPKLVEIRSAAQRFRERKWETPANQLLTALRFKFEGDLAPGDPEGLQQAIENLWQEHAVVAPVIRRIEDDWQSIQKYNAKLVATNDALLKNYLPGLDLSAKFDSGLAVTRLSDMKTPLETISVPLREWASLGGQLVAQVESKKWGQINQEEFQKSPAHKEAVASVVNYRRWIVDFNQAPVQRPTFLPPGWDAVALKQASKRLEDLSRLRETVVAFKDVPKAFEPAPAIDLQARGEMFKTLEIERKKLEAEQPADTPKDQFDARRKSFEDNSAQLVALLNKDFETLGDWRKRAVAAHDEELASIKAEQVARLDKANAEDRRRIEQEQADLARREAIEDLVAAAREARLEGVQSAAIQNAWRDQLNVLDRNAIDKKLAVTDVQPRIDQLKQHLVALDAEMPRLELTFATNRPWHDVAKQILEGYAGSMREQMLGKFAKTTLDAEAKPVGPADSSRKEFKAAAAARTKWNADARQLIVAYDTIETRLAEAYLLNEKASDGSTLASLATTWRDHYLLKVASGNQTVMDAVEPVRDPLIKLASLDPEAPGAATNTRRTLIDIVNSPSSASAQRTAWLLLRDLNPAWPATLAEIEKEAELMGSLEAQFASIPNSTRSQFLLGRMKGAGEETLRDFFNRATEPDQIAAARDALNPGRLSQLKIVLSPDAFLTTVDRDTRFNIELLKLSENVAKMSKPEKPADAKNLIAAFRDRVLSLVPADAGKAAEDKAYFGTQLKPYTDLLTRELAPVATGKTGGTAAGPSGPAVSLKDWSQQALPDGNLEFTGPGGRKLTFARLPTSGSYLCTEEMSVGLFLDVIQATGKEGLVRSLLFKGSASAADQRKGVRVWDWQPTATGLKISASWYFSVPRVSPQFPSPEPPPPGEQQPMQQLSARAAAYVAQLMGCRIPTPAEWQEAYGIVKQRSSTGVKWNRRDATWEAQRQYILKQFAAKAGQGLAYPDAGIFSLPTDKNVGEKASPGLPSDDGFLLFADVDSPIGEPFRHLIGNVAEYVSDAPRDWYATMQGAAAEKINQDVRGLIKGGNISVIGGSAMSNTDLIPIDAPQPLGTAKSSPIEVITASGGFADVGMRLALDATGGGAAPPPAPSKPFDIVTALKELVGQPVAKTADARVARPEEPAPERAINARAPDQSVVNPLQTVDEGAPTTPARKPGAKPRAERVVDQGTVQDVNSVGDSQPPGQGQFVEEPEPVEELQ